MDKKMDPRHVKAAVSAFIMMFAAAFVTSCLSYFVVPITTELGYDRSAFTLYYTLIGLVTMVCMPFAGKLAGKLGVRKIVIVGGIWSTIGFFILSRCTSLFSFYGAGVYLGFLGQICTNLMAIITVNAWFIAKRGSIMGIVGASSGACGVIAGFVMPNMIATVGWRNSYLALGAGMFLCTVPVALFLLKDSPQAAGLMPYGYEEKKTDGAAEAPKEAAGVPYKIAIKSLPFILLFVSFLLVSYVAGVLQHLPAYFMGKNLTGVQAGSIMSIFMLAMIFAKIFMGIMNDKLGLKVTTALIVGSFAVSCIIMPLLSGYAALAGIMILMSFGFGSLTVLAPLIAGLVFGQKEFAGIWGILGMSAALGTAIGAPIWGAIYDVTGSYDGGFFSAAVLLAIVIALIFYSINAGKKLPMS
jgi:MFS family permease